MRRALLKFSLLAIAVFSTAIAVGFLGALHEKNKLDKDLLLLNSQLTEHMSRLRNLPTLLASNSDVLTILSGSQSRSQSDEKLNQLVLVTGTYEILIVDPKGNLLARGLRNPDQNSSSTNDFKDQIFTMQYGSLARRILNDDIWLYEVGRYVQSQNNETLGYIFVRDSFEALEEVWRALSNRLRVTTKDGRQIFSSRAPFAYEFDFLKSSKSNLITGTQTTLIANPKILLSYFVHGFGYCLVLTVIILLWRKNVRQQISLAQTRLENLTQNASLLEKRVNERTVELRQEIERRSNAEKALKESQDQLIQTAKFKVLGDMASGISHEFSQPFLALKVSLETLEKQLEANSEKSHKTLNKALSIAARMEKILKNLRMFARNEIESAKPCDIPSNVNAALDILSAQIKRTQAQIEHNPPSSDFVFSAGDTRLQQVIVNIVTNALEEIPQDGSGIICINFERSEERGLIHIEDNGPGFTDPAKAIKPFYTNKTDQRGLGLGLSISSNIIANFGGSIKLGESELGGAKVTIALLEADQAGNS